MTVDELFRTLKERFSAVLRDNNLENAPVEVRCRALSPEEAIGNTKRRDFPILTGKDVMIEAEWRGFRGQAFTDSPALFSGTLSDVMAIDLTHDAGGRAIFIATMNAVMRALGRVEGTVHCRKDGPELCAADMKAYLASNYPDVKKITLVGYQPALFEMLAGAGYELRVLDLNPANIGTVKYGVRVGDGVKDMAEAIASAELILCTGSTLCNGTAVDYFLPDKEVVFFGITMAAAAELLGLKRICFAEKYKPQQ